MIYINKILKAAVVLLIAIAMVFSSVVVTADIVNNKNEIKTSYNENKDRGSSSVLWDNGLPDNRTLIPCFYKPDSGIDVYVVDDFVVPEPGWIVTDAHFQVWFFAGHHNEIDAIWVYFFEDIGDEPDYNAYYEFQSFYFSAYLTGDLFMYAIDVYFDVNPAILSPGKWWVCLKPELNGDAYTQWLTANGFGTSIWIDWLPDYPRWTWFYDITQEHYDVSFTLTGEAPPTAPYITGPAQGDPNKLQEFKFQADDFDSPKLKYHIDWDDGTPIETTGYFPTGTQADVTHTYTKSGKYIITAYAEDEDGNKGSTGTFTFTCPRDKAKNNILLLRLLERFPLLQKLIQNLGL